MTAFHTKTTVTGIDAENALEQLLGHLREHELIAVRKDDAWEVEYANTRILFLAKGDMLRADVTAPTQDALYEGRMMAFYHIQEYSGCEPEAIQWEGDSVAFERPPAFRLITVAAVTDVGPHMRRVRFRNSDLQRYDQNDNLHCKLIFPQPGDEQPEWPTLAANGVPQFPKGEKHLDVRTYTIRRISAREGWFEVDFVLHDDAGPGARWADQAAVGQQLGMSGPGGRTAPSTSWMLLAGDETALPAICRIGETLPAGTRGHVIVEVQSSQDEIPMTLPKGMALQWIYRDKSAAGENTLLADAIQACTIPENGDRFVWVGAELSTAQTVRKWLRDDIGLSGKEQLVVAYWRHGMDETQMKSAPARDSAGNASAKSKGEAESESGARS